MTHSSTAINPHAAQPTSLVSLAKSLWRNRQLIVQMTKREVAGRYKGSVMGLAWWALDFPFMTRRSGSRSSDLATTRRACE